MSLQLGPHTLDAIETGTVALDGGAMFGIVPRTLWEKKIPPDERNRIHLAARCLLVRSGPRVILVDVGMGDHWNEKERGLYGITGTGPTTDEQLAKFGLTRESVTDVILTHLHFDHAGGALNRESLPAFPRATYHVQRRNWEWSLQPSDRDRGSYRRQTFEALGKTGSLHLIDGEQELFPGIELLLSEGHTTALQLVRVKSDDGWLVFCSDLIPTSAHFAPAWGMGYDLRPLQLIEEKKVLLAEALEDRGILFFEHDPAMQACRVREERGEVVVDQAVTLT